MKDFDFYTDNYDCLVEQYLNQWIAIYGEQVVAFGLDYFEMEDQVEEPVSKVGMPVGV